MEKIFSFKTDISDSPEFYIINYYLKYTTNPYLWTGFSCLLNTSDNDYCRIKMLWKNTFNDSLEYQLKYLLIISTSVRE